MLRTRTESSHDGCQERTQEKHLPWSLLVWGVLNRRAVNLDGNKRALYVSLTYNGKFLLPLLRNISNTPQHYYYLCLGLSPESQLLLYHNTVLQIS